MLCTPEYVFVGVVYDNGLRKCCKRTCKEIRFGRCGLLLTSEYLVHRIRQDPKPDHVALALKAPVPGPIHLHSHFNKSYDVNSKKPN
jgi:hypothetical protein